jgi:release factor glutamine methyltransferase
MHFSVNMRLLDALRSMKERLESAGIEDAFPDSEILVLHASGIARLTAYTENPEIDGRLLSRIRRLVERRAKGEPVQYITGHVEFLGLDIRVGKGVLIPRPETELLALEAIHQLKGEESKIKSRGKDPSLLTPHTSPRILDLCTGSGCIALAVGRDFPHAAIFGTDISEEALGYAKRNAAANSICNVAFLKGSLFEPVSGLPPFDLIISNPPYIKSGDIGGLQREIREWEPLSALDGGEDGLTFYREIFAGAGRHMKEAGKIIAEIGFGQAEEVREISERAGFRKISFKKDFAGIKRIIKAEK